MGRSVDNMIMVCTDNGINGLTSVKFGLLFSNRAGYSGCVVLNRATGRDNPNNKSAIHDANSVFFCIVNNAIAYQTMVAQAGQLSGWPVSDLTGIVTPVWATTLFERDNSGGSKYCYNKSEIIIMMATPTQPHPQFIWLFLAVRRADCADRPHRESVTASTYQDARRVIARDFVAVYAGQLPTGRVSA